jgi:ribosomal protein L5
MMRQEHYDRVVVWDRLARYPQLRHKTQVPRIDQVTLHWSLRSVGMTANAGVAAMRALYRRTGHQARRHFSGESLAAWKVREGDLVACSVTLSAGEAMAFLETWLVRVLPQRRSFEGRPASYVDQQGGISVPRTNPMRFPALEPRYERLHPRCSRPGLTRHLRRKGDTHDREVVRSLLTGRGFPLRGPESRRKERRR